jgi:hypothetical protein
MWKILNEDPQYIQRKKFKLLFFREARNNPALPNSI